MAANLKAMIKNAFGQLLPQYFNRSTDTFEALEGDGGAMHVAVMGSNATDGTTGAAVSYVLDESGRPVQRVVNAAPQAYDQASDAFKVSVVQRNTPVEEVVLLNAAAIRDLNAIQTPTDLRDVSRFRKIRVLVRDTHNQPVQVRAKIGTTTLGYESLWNQAGAVAYTYVNLKNAGYVNDLEDLLPFLGREGIYNIYFEFKATTAPTTGSLTVVLLGVY